jgi:hypothetical protein
LGLLKQQGWRVHQLNNGYIRWLREQKQGGSLALREDSPEFNLSDDELDEILCGPPAVSASTP